MYSASNPDAEGEISIHAPRAGGDLRVNALVAVGDGISIHAPRAGGDREHRLHFPLHAISIHAPRAGGDPRLFERFPKQEWISIHAPRAGGDLAFS